MYALLLFCRVLKRVHLILLVVCPWQRSKISHNRLATDYTLLRVCVGVRVITECHEICTDDGCTSYMRSDYTLSCDGSLHATYVPFGWVAYLIVAIASPAGIAYFVLKHRTALQVQHGVTYRIICTVASCTRGLGGHDYRCTFVCMVDHRVTLAVIVLPLCVCARAQVWAGLSFFSKPFKQELLAWEAVDLLRKMSITSIVNFIGPGQPLQLYAGISFAGFFWLIDGYFLPYKSPVENVLNCVCNFAIFMTLVLGGINQSGVDQTSEISQALVGVLMVGTNGIVISLVLVIGYMKRVEMKAQKAQRARQIHLSMPDALKHVVKLNLSSREEYQDWWNAQQVAIDKLVQQAASEHGSLDVRVAERRMLFMPSTIPNSDPLDDDGLQDCGSGLPYAPDKGNLRYSVSCVPCASHTAVQCPACAHMHMCGCVVQCTRITQILVTSGKTGITG